HRSHISHDQDKKRELHGNVDPATLVQVVSAWREEHCEAGGYSEYEKMHVSGELPDPRASGKQYSDWMQGRRHIVVKEFRITEYVSGLRVVIDEPQTDRQQRCHQSQPRPPPLA